MLFLLVDREPWASRNAIDAPRHHREIHTATNAYRPPARCESRVGFLFFFKLDLKRLTLGEQSSQTRSRRCAEIRSALRRHLPWPRLLPSPSAKGKTETVGLCHTPAPPACPLHTLRRISEVGGSCPPVLPLSTSQAVLRRVQLNLHGTRSTPHVSLHAWCTVLSNVFPVGEIPTRSVSTL